MLSTVTVSNGTRPVWVLSEWKLWKGWIFVILKLKADNMNVASIARFIMISIVCLRLQRSTHRIKFDTKNRTSSAIVEWFPLFTFREHVLPNLFQVYKCFRESFIEVSLRVNLVNSEILWPKGLTLSAERIISPNIHWLWFFRTQQTRYNSIWLKFRNLIC